MLLAGALSACGGGGHHAQATPAPATTATTVAPPQPASLDAGATLALATGPAPADWNPDSSAATGTPAGLVAAEVLPSVFVAQPDFSLVLNSDLVTSARQTKAAPQTVVYQINPKAVWSDGVPITWSDFQYNWEAQSGDGAFEDVGKRAYTPASTAGYHDIASVRATNGDPDTVTVVYSKPFPDWRSLFTDMVPAHVAQKVGFDRGFTDPVDDLVSGGPFLVESYQAGRSVTLVRNARWWGTPASMASVTVDFVPASSVAVTALRLGEVGAATVAEPTSALLTALDAISGVKVLVTPGATFEELQFDPSGPSGPAAAPWMADPDLRQALMLALDRSALIASTVGTYAPATAPLGNRFFVPAEAAYTDNSGGRYAHADLTAAKTLLGEGGYTDTGGLLTKSGRQVTLRLTAAPVGSGTAPSLAALHRAIESAVVGAAAQLGINVTVVPASTAGGADMEVVDRVASPDLSAEAAALGAGDLGSGTAAVTVGALLARAGATTNVSARDRLYNAADADLWHDAASLPLFQLPTVLATAPRYLGVAPNAAAGPTWNLARWGVEDSS